MNLPAHAPIMVLPGALLFPNALLPLYIFEERYRKMLAYSLEQQRMFCIAQMKPGITEAKSAADFFHIAGLGLIRACVGKEDGTSHLVMQGLARVELGNFFQDTPFRIAEIRALSSQMSNEVEAQALGAKVLEICSELRAKGLELPPTLEEYLPHLSNPEILSDVISHTLVSDPLRGQLLLEELSVSGRLRMLIQYLQSEK